uniref:Uncharacterized protein n=1 Tax=Lotharella vacuolata TaxID=74820 RepID=A0A0H5BK90_9EUKA|nr:hypothetical protein [Lotharella vacuolata]
MLIYKILLIQKCLKDLVIIFSTYNHITNKNIYYENVFLKQKKNKNYVNLKFLENFSINILYYDAFIFRLVNIRYLLVRCFKK